MNTIITKFSTWFYYVAAHMTPRYRYTLEGEKENAQDGSSVLLYRRAGKRHLMEATAEQLCNEKELIENFHPLDVRTICFIAGAELISLEKKSERQQKLASLKARIFSD